MEADRFRYRVDTLFPVKKKRLQKLKEEPTMKFFQPKSTNLICAVCFGINARACRGCFSIAYCSRDHQIQHWREHSQSCKPLVSVNKDEVLCNLSLRQEDRNGDRYMGMYKAARNLKPTDIALELRPIMHVAFYKGLPIPPDSILCLGCNKWYQASQGYRCSKCKWPVCSDKCEMDSMHAKFECKIFVEHKVFPPIIPALYDGDAVLALRCLMLMDIKPSDYQQLMALESVVDHVTRNKQSLEADERVARFLLHNCRFQESKGITFPAMMNFLKLIDYCSIWLPERWALMGDKQYSYVSVKYVFPSKILVAEECNPNCNWSLRHSPDIGECSIRLKTCIPIQAGQYLTVCFSGISEYGASFPKRYENARFNLQCRCRRCSDPTEGGSFFSGVKCHSCDDFENGYFLPGDTQDFYGPWCCYNTNCTNITPGVEIMREMDRIYKEILENTNSLQGLLSMLKRYEKVKLHRNHYLIMKATQLSIDLCWGVCQNSALHTISISLLDKAKSLTDKLMSIFLAVYPWNSTQNAQLLFHYQMLHGIAKVRELFWLTQQVKLPADDKRLWPNDFWDIVNIQKDAVAVLIDEPPGSAEYEKAVLMMGVLEDTQSLLILERRDHKIQYETVMGLQNVYARYCSGYLHSILPVFEDKELSELQLFTGSYCKELLEKTNFIK